MASTVPTLRAERALWHAGMSRIVGVDECGVASLAGPVVAAACLVKANCRRIPGVRDSKTLSAAQRRRLALEIRRRSVAIAVGSATVAEVDRLNIYHATHLAMRRALARVRPYDHVLVDGRRIVGFDDVGPHTTIVDGDATSYAIACASVVAKVVRDRLLALLAQRHPGYGWERNAGYPTAGHLAAIRELGITPSHRRSFAPVRIAACGEQVEMSIITELETADAIV